ncbi:MAG: glycoside hydrolase [Candidatus Hydrogenedentes bacterium]|nr:glycoside hydrolase [Candidatus Hydrogenedentota bacterium]
MLRSLICALVCLLANANLAAQETPWPETLQTQHWPGAYWWIPGSALAEGGIAYNLKTMNEAGIRNVHMIPIYGAKGYEAQYIPFLSTEWMEKLDFIVKTGRELGMSVDMTTGTGWCFGGPGMEGDLGDTILSRDEATGAPLFGPGRKVKRAAPGGEGMMLNPYSPAAMQRYLMRFSEAFDMAKPALPRAQYHDSFEYQGNWAPEVLTAFRERRGYDLEARLTEMLDPITPPETLSRLKYDYRLTLAELHRETMQVWVDWCHSRGMLARNEAHGGPANLLDLYAQADIPETEMFGAPEYPIPGFTVDPEMSREGDTDLRVCMMAASAAHIAHAPGKQLVSSESCTWLREHWHTTLGQVKLQMDEFFLAGINHVFFHGSCYSPQDAPWPGWYFYASTKFDWRNSIWRDLPHLNDYIARCQSVLQAGQPENDVLLYWPVHDLWSNPEFIERRFSVHGPAWMAESSAGAVAQQFMDAGYSFDFVSDDLLKGITFRNERLHAAGASYRAIVAPRCQYMPAATLERLAALAAQGATVLFQDALPEDIPGFAQLDAQRALFARAHTQLAAAGVTVSDLSAVLQRAGIVPEPLAAAGLKFIRRRIEDGRYYFIANHSARAVDGWMALALPFASAVLHDPMTGTAAALPVRGKEIYLQLDAGASVILHASTRMSTAPSFVPLERGGEAMALNGPWSLDFIEGGPALPAPQSLTELASWAAAPDPAAQAFAGTGRYTIQFNLPNPAAADEWILDLGVVCESARVRINGEEAGTLVALPMKLRVGACLRPGGNTLEIEVTNLSANRMRAHVREHGPLDTMHEINIVNVDYKPFVPESWPLAGSGLLGPVRLQPMRRLALE